MSRSVHSRTQDLIFTLYGDYLSHWDDSIWIGVLIELLKALGCSEQAVRSTTSRMGRKGWLSVSRRGRNSYYSMTPPMVEILNRGTQQIYYAAHTDWDGYWYLVNYAFTGDQDRIRHELCKRLSWLGFGWLGNSTWISPRDRGNELREILEMLGIRQKVDYFRVQHLLSAEATSLAQRCWNLTELNHAYRQFIETYQPQFEQDRAAAQRGKGLTQRCAFTKRFWLVHEYRYFPFRDPYLPAELLPSDWLGNSAIDLFRSYHDLLKDRANAYIDQVMAATPLHGFQFGGYQPSSQPLVIKEGSI